MMRAEALSTHAVALALSPVNEEAMAAKLDEEEAKQSKQEL